MPYKCCVPHCGSNQQQPAYISMFRFPKDEDSRQKWAKNIPRENLVITKYTRVCAKHFVDSEIITDLASKPLLKEGAVPRFFENCPSYLSIPEKKKRCDPEERRSKIALHAAQKEEKVAQNDSIKSLTDLKENLFKITNTQYLHHVTDHQIAFYKLDYRRSPKVAMSMIICEDLKFKLFKEDQEIDVELVVKSYPKKSVTKFSEVAFILHEFSNYMTQNKYGKDQESIILQNIDKQCSQLLESLAESDDYPQKEKIKFLCEQFHLLLLEPGAYRYSPETLIISFIILGHSRGAYDSIRLNNVLTLPNPSHLRKLSSSLQIGAENNGTNSNFLSRLVSNLNPLEKYVILCLDEIYVKEEITYKSGKLIGQAQNNLTVAAKTIQTFMVHSAFGSFKEVVGLVPVKILTGDFLAQLTRQALQLVQNCGLQVIVIMSDNCRVNQKTFQLLLQEPSGIQYAMKNPTYEDSYIFLMYDTVHILKNIRNSWLNQKDSNKTLAFPDFENPYPFGNNVCAVKEACFSDLRTLYENESGQLLKEGFKLSYKSLYPNSLERQNVRLVNAVFHETTIAALCSKGPDEHFTSEFLQIINNWWNLVNTKSKLKGLFQRKDLCIPFTKTDDPRFLFFDKFLNWLDTWKQLNLTSGTLTKDTMQAIYQSTYVLKEVIQYALVHLKVPYVLTGKFQSDNLERRFGRYRQMSGCSYNVTVTQVLEAERKLRIKSVLGIHSSRYGPVTMNSGAFSSPDEEPTCEDQPPNDSEETHNESALYSILETDYLNKECDINTLIYVAGHTSHKLCNKIACADCKLKLRASKGQTSESTYFNGLQRGGLTLATEPVFQVVKHVLALMQGLILEPFEAVFLQEKNQRNVLKKLAEKSILKDEFLANFSEEVCHCGAELKHHIYSIIKTSSNILLNNYSKHKNDIIAKAKNEKEQKENKEIVEKPQKRKRKLQENKENFEKPQKDRRKYQNYVSSKVNII